MEILRTLFEYKNGNLYWLISPSPKVKAGTLAGHKTNKVPYKRVKYQGKGWPVHKIIYYLHTGIWSKKYIDHINRDKLDNRIENLREVFPFENSRNQDKCDRELPIGVYKVGKKYVARLRHPSIHIGTYNTPEEAELNFNRAFKESRNEF